MMKKGVLTGIKYNNAVMIIGLDMPSYDATEEEIENYRNDMTKFLYEMEWLWNTFTRT